MNQNADIWIELLMAKIKALRDPIINCIHVQIYLQALRIIVIILGVYVPQRMTRHEFLIRQYQTYKRLLVFFNLCLSLIPKQYSERNTSQMR